MKKSILLVGCVVFASVVFGQSSVDSKNVDRLSSTSETPTKSAVGNERVSDYYQFEKKLMTWTKGRTIPASVPKHEAQSKSDYAVIILNWAKDNKELLEDKFKAKVSDDAQFAKMIAKAKELK
jgi:hypothetical protein